MTPEEQLDEARVKEAERRWNSNDPTIPDIATGAARLAREGWTPPEPEVDPDVLAWREWYAKSFPTFALEINSGHWDQDRDAKVFLAGARMAREQERERAKVLVEYVQDRRYEDAQADRIHAKYTGRRCDD